MTMSATFQSLSQELVDEVVSCLEDDKPSLFACSLTCRSLLPGCQRALFSNLCVGGSPPASPGTTNVASVQSFLKMMEAIPQVSGYAKSLKLTFTFLIKKLDGPLAKQLASFRGLTRFSLHLTDYPGSYLLLSSELKASIQNILRLRTLEHLQLVDVPLQVIPSETSVKHLVFRICDLKSWQRGAKEILLKGGQPRVDGPRSDGEIAMAIESLDLDDSEFDIQLAVDYVLDSPILDLSVLKRLQIDIEDIKAYDQHEHISRLLRACSSLQVLRFIPSTHTMALPVGTEVGIGNLSPLGSLRVFATRLHTISFGSSNEVWTPFNWLLRLLRTLPESNSLEEITLHIVHPTVCKSPYKSLHHFGKCIPWETLAPLLTGRFAHLRKVKLLLQAEVMPILNQIVNREHPQALELENIGLLTIREWDADVDSWDTRSAGFVKFQDSF